MPSHNPVDILLTHLQRWRGEMGNQLCALYDLPEPYKDADEALMLADKLIRLQESLTNCQALARRLRSYDTQKGA